MSGAVVPLRWVVVAGALLSTVGVAGPLAGVWARTRWGAVPEGVVEAGTVVRAEAVLPWRPDLVVMRAPGRVTIGSPSDEQGRPTADELAKSSYMLDEPEREVALAEDFALSVTEVTQGQWAALMNTRPSYFDAKHGGGDDHPVERVSAYDAMAYLNALSRREGLEVCYPSEGCTGTPGAGCAAREILCNGDYVCPSVEPKPGCRGYRLPSEVEWEYAARVGTRTAVYVGPLVIRGDNDAPALDPIAWYGGNSGLAGGVDCSQRWERQDTAVGTCGTHQVARKRPSPWRLHDVIGNVSEWTRRVDDGLQPAEAQRAKDQTLVLRGCSWGDAARDCRAAYRDVFPPASRFHLVGFRVARSFPRPSNP